MRVVVKDFHTEIYPSEQEIKELCKVGKGADCCIWLVVGSEFECTYYNKHPYLLKRWKDGLTVAKRDGCDKVRELLG